MKHFIDVWKFTDKIPGSFTRLSGEMLYSAALQSNGPIVEVGVDQGRSASLLLAAVAGSDQNVILIDSWESVLIENMAKVEMMALDFPSSIFSVLNMKSVDAAAELKLLPPIGLIHIDAHHFDDIPDGGPSADCIAWLPMVRAGGVACFHDYNSCFPDVNIAVDKYCAGWEDMGDWDGLAIRRKP